MSACLPLLVKRSTISLTSKASRRLHKQSMPLLRSQPCSSSSNTPDAGSFTYRIAAASSPKRAPPRPPKPGQDYWNYASTHENPSPPYLRSTKKDSGEDAFFATTIGGSQHHVAFGVADGVGGWQDQGVDPSEYSQALCGLMAGTANIHEDIEGGAPCKAQPLLQKAYDAVMANPRIAAGGCTASLGVADKSGNVETANLGDSGYLIFGPGKVAHRSVSQTHAFNTPYQMSKVPPKMQAQYAIFGGATYFSETPEDADVSHHQLKHGDIVLFATDGVWDNLSAQDTLQIVQRIMEEGGYWSQSRDAPGAETKVNSTRIRSMPRKIEGSIQESFLPGQIAAAVMREAKIAGLDRRRDGPFAKEVKQHYPQEGWEGGKPDDIAVVVCIAVQEDGSYMNEERPIKAKL
ncbi:Protein phosphatase PTC7-like fig [Pseudocercospora fuligena]|uniref:Protein phosphatase n=1 Tax=Pseudocercospora fuligena TaxID=685502 RepID=A0A8H6RI59_9PEZI|nr:Protein phosphatase PTC7-like fig [Pseudocercospora fuligena]